MLAYIFYFAYNVLGISGSQEFYCHECELAKQQAVFEKKELKCLQEVVYFEARSLPDKSKAMIAQTTLNRSKSSVGRSTICATVYVPSIYKEYYKACAYSFTCDGKSEAMHERKARDKAYLIAKNALSGKYKSLTRADHFLRCDVAVKLSWVKSMIYDGTDGTHCFYRGK